MHTTALTTKRFARFELRALFALMAAWSVWPTLWAQYPDSAQTSILLPALTIREARFERTGCTVWKADSLPGNAVLSLADRLLLENILDVRANAPGTLATLSFRGMGPGRTPVFWNGMNLQSPMNGVVDAALLPLWPDDLLEVQYGGQSATQSSGAMAGSVVLEQGKQRFNAGFSGFSHGATGSFNRWETGAGLAFSNQKFASMARANWLKADNDFTYQKQGLDGRFYAAHQTNNQLWKGDFQQFNQWRLNEKNTLATAYWHQNAWREIPAATTETPRKSWQRDCSHRGLVRWEHAPNTRIAWVTRAAWLDDYLAFHLAADTDTSHSRQAQLSTERAATFGRRWSWRTGASALRQWARVDGYADSTHWFAQNRLAAFGTTEWAKGDFRISALLRQEWAENQAAPFTWSLGTQMGLGRVGELKAHLSRNFNLPTLNDRFWDKLGRPNLRPEKGYSGDLSWHLQRETLEFTLNGFQILLDDWILWQPDSNLIYRPDNLRKVWGRGAELGAKWRSKPESNTGMASNSKWLLEISGKFQASKTTSVAVYDGYVNILGKQLPYTPLWSGGLSVQASRGKIAAAYFQQFTGSRLDNNQKPLKGYSIGNLIISAALLKSKLSLNCRLDNLWNTRYEIIRYRPMPGRSWQIGVGYRW